MVTVVAKKLPVSEKVFFHRMVAASLSVHVATK